MSNLLVIIPADDVPAELCDHILQVVGVELLYLRLELFRWQHPRPEGVALLHSAESRPRHSAFSAKQRIA